MTFSDETVKSVFDIVGGECECRRESHNHPEIRCGKKLVWENRGREGHGAWEAHHINANGGDGCANCEILCWDCHQLTF